MQTFEYPNLVSGSADGTGWVGYGNVTVQTGDAISVTTSDNGDDINAILTSPLSVTSGTPYTLTAEVKATPNFSGTATGMVSLTKGILAARGLGFDIPTEWAHISVTLTPSGTASDAMVAFLAGSRDGSPASLYVRNLMLVEGSAPAAWAPAEGETLAGGRGALMSANLLEGVKPKLASGATESDGIISIAANTGSERNVVEYAIPGQSALSANQTCHIGVSLRTASGGNEWTSVVVEYADSAGNANGVSNVTSATGDGAWHRHELSVVVPSGMHVVGIHFNQDASGTAIDFANPTLSYGSPVTLASDAHTPYATQDHLAAEYATKAALKVTSDAVTAEVTERGKLSGRVGTLESTTGTHTSKLEQLATSIRSLVKGESTYTDPDGASATSGIYSLVTQTRDSVTALFGSYTKTADLASTQAVRDAKKAGTDAQAAASAAQTTADSAKSATDSLATLIRADSTGITVGKSADGKTWSTGRTRMDEDSFDILDKAGKIITQMAKDGASFLSGLVRIVVGTGTLPGNKTANFISVDAGSGVAGLSGIISRLDAAINGIKSSVSAGWEQDFGYGVTAVVRESETVASAAHLASDKAELHVGDNSMKVTGDGFKLSHPEYFRKGLRITQGSKVCHGHGTPWVTLFDTWADFQAATGCYDSGTPTLVTMNGDYSAFDGTLSGCEIRGGYPVYALAQTTGGLPNLSSSQALRINWICIW